MIATAFTEENDVLGPPPGATEDEVHSLSVWRGLVGNCPCVISCWKPTAAEWEEMQRTGRVWVVVMGVSMPPIMPLGTNPFEWMSVEKNGG